MPVQRRSGTRPIHPIPALSMPMSEILIASIRDEFQIFPIGDQLLCDIDGMQKNLVPSLFVVEAKAVSPKSDFIDAFRNGNQAAPQFKSGGHGGCHSFMLLDIRGEERVVPENIFDIRQ